MKYGLGKGWMGILFAVLMIITFGFAYNSVQSNTICLAWQKAFGFEPSTMGIVLTVLTLLIISVESSVWQNSLLQWFLSWL